MNLSQNMKFYLLSGLGLLTFLLIVGWVGEIIIPFILAIFLAHLAQPIIRKIQTKIPNRRFAVSSFLTIIGLGILGIVFFLGSHLVNDANRLAGAVNSFMDENKTEINEMRESILSFTDEVYQNEALQSQIAAADTLTDEEKEEGLMTALENVYSFFESNETAEPVTEHKTWNWFIMLINTVIYTILILYSYSYFEDRYQRYFGSRASSQFNKNEFLKDFDQVFVQYFRQRGKVVLLSAAIFIIAFSILNLPGAIIIGLCAGILTYAAHFHYLSLPVTAIGCWVLSIEHDIHFLWFFGIVLFIYILVSVLEELVFFPKIMKSVGGMNPAIMVLSFTLWISIFGGFIGTILALPLTQLILLYIDRFMTKREDLKKGLIE